MYGLAHNLSTVIHRSGLFSTLPQNFRRRHAGIKTEVPVRWEGLDGDATVEEVIGA